MRKYDNIIIADNDKCLKTPNGVSKEVPLGTFTEWRNGNLVTITNRIEDIKEVTPIRILDEIYYIESTSYEDMVTELIRLKYTLDQELALYANSFIKDNSEQMKEYLNWRVLCKEAVSK